MQTYSGNIMQDFILNSCIFGPLTKGVIDRYNPFECGNDEDMDDFFRDDAISYRKYQMGNTYCFLSTENSKDIVACFTVSNDSLRIYDLPNSRRNAMQKITNREKMLSRFPGVLIGRLAVSKKYKHQGVGSQVLKFLKFWFAENDDK